MRRFFRTFVLTHNDDDRNLEDLHGLWSVGMHTDKGGFFVLNLYSVLKITPRT